MRTILIIIGIAMLITSTAALLLGSLRAWRVQAAQDGSGSTWSTERMERYGSSDERAATGESRRLPTVRVSALTLRHDALRSKGRALGLML